MCVSCVCARACFVLVLCACALCACRVRVCVSSLTWVSLVREAAVAKLAGGGRRLEGIQGRKRLERVPYTANSQSVKASMIQHTVKYDAQLSAVTCIFIRTLLPNQNIKRHTHTAHTRAHRLTLLPSQNAARNTAHEMPMAIQILWVSSCSSSAAMALA